MYDGLKRNYDTSKSSHAYRDGRPTPTWSTESSVYILKLSIYILIYTYNKTWPL